MENKNTTIISFIQSPKGLAVIVICIVMLLSVYLLLSSQSGSITGIPNPTPTIAQAGTSQNSGAMTNNNGTTNRQQPTAYPTVATAVKTAQLSFEKQGSWVNLVLDTGSTPVSGVQVSISYNPAQISNINITPGTFFTSPVVLQNKVDETMGVISYVIAIPSGEQQKTGKGPIATISYQLHPGVQTAMTFLPDTKITSVGVNGSVMSAAEPILLP